MRAALLAFSSSVLEGASAQVLKRSTQSTAMVLVSLAAYVHVLDVVTFAVASLASPISVPPASGRRLARQAGAGMRAPAFGHRGGRSRQGCAGPGTAGAAR